jgi:alpha-glucosidase
MRIEEFSGGFRICLKEREIFSLHTHGRMSVFAFCIRQSLKYKANRGTFTVKEKTEERIPLSKYKIISDSEIQLYNGDIYLNIRFAGGQDALPYTSTVADGILSSRILRMDFESNFDGTFEFRFPSHKDEGIFGGGEQFRQLNLKGERVTNFVSEHIALKPILQKTLFSFLPYRTKKHSEINSYSPMPTFVSSDMYALKFNTDSYGVQDFTNQDYSVYRYASLPSSLLYVEGGSFSEIAEALAKDTLNRQYLPDWCHEGVIIGVQGGIDKAEEKARAMIDKGAKVCGVWCQDWSGKKITVAGKQVYWNWEVDDTLYPNLKERIAELNKIDVAFLAYINPYLIQDGKMYNHFKDSGWLIKKKDGSIYHIMTTTFKAGMMDLTHPDAVQYIKDIIIKKNMLDLGVKGYMADFGEYLPVDCVLHEGDPKRLHNMWPVIWARMNREAVDEWEKTFRPPNGNEDVSGTVKVTQGTKGQLSCPRDSIAGKNIMFFTRSGYAGAENYTPIMWNGDQHTDYSEDYGMPSVIPASLNLGFSGLTVVHSDVGGYISFNKLKRDKELFVRWMEMNTFSPLMRTHETVRPEENAQPDSPDVIDYTVKFTNIHAGLKPYIQDCLEKARSGIPVMAPDFYYSDFDKHHDTYSYFFGRDIFVAPIVTKGSTERIVMLPDGDWIHFFTKLRYSGEAVVPAPLGTPAVFYRAESEYRKLFDQIDKSGRQHE